MTEVLDFMINLTVIIKAFVLLVAAIGTGYVIPLIKAKVSAGKLAEAVKWAQIAVNAAEMIWRGVEDSGEDKKYYVEQFLRKKGFELDADEIDSIIEAAVLDMKAQLLEYSAISAAVEGVAGD